MIYGISGSTPANVSIHVNLGSLCFASITNLVSFHFSMDKIVRGYDRLLFDSFD